MIQLAPLRQTAAASEVAAPRASAAEARAVPKGARVAFIGDSHSAWTFGKDLREQLGDYLKAGGGKLTTFKGVPSSSVSHWLHGGTTHAGSQTFRVPPLSEVLAKKPSVLVVALGTNMLHASKDANVSQIRKLMRQADAAGTKVVWVGPPDVRGFSGELRGAAPEQRFYAALREVNEGRAAHSKKPIEIVSSRPSTREQDSFDGIHFDGRFAHAWADDVFRRLTT